MPEKDKGLVDKLINVFRPRKITYDDIVCQAETVISDYVSRRRNEIIAKYGKKKRSFAGFVIFCISGAALFCLYVILR